MAGAWRGGYDSPEYAEALAIRMIPQLPAAIGRAFSEHGYNMPETFVVRPSQGARRDK